MRVQQMWCAQKLVLIFSRLMIYTIMAMVVVVMAMVVVLVTIVLAGNVGRVVASGVDERGVTMMTMTMLVAMVVTPGMVMVQ